MPPRSSKLALACLLCACAGRTPRPETPQREEIVVDEATVVTAHPAGAGPATDDEPALPPLPGPERAPSAGLERGLTLGRALLEAPATTTPAPDDQAGYDIWLKDELQPWLEARGKAVQAMVAPLSEIAPDDVAEQVVAAALVGVIYARTHEALLGVPPPPPVRRDEKLLHIYLDGVHQTTAVWVESAVAALRRCAELAALQRDASFVPWLDRCQTKLGKLQQQLQAAKALAQTVEQERAADAAAMPATSPAAAAMPAAAAAPSPAP